MRRMVMAGLALLLVGSVGAGAGMALAAPGVGGKNPAPEAGAAEGTIVVDPHDNASLVVHVDGNPGGRVVKRSFGVQNVTNPAPGRFCIRPTAESGVSPADSVPTVATDYFGTAGFDGFAQWNSSRQGCPVGTFAVNTFDASEASALNDVAFTLVVP